MNGAAFAQPIPSERDEPEYRMSMLMLGYARRAAATNPRKAQRRTGMSGYGDPCHRKIAMEAAELPPVNDKQDEWASTLGTWAHAGLTEVLRAAPDAADWLLDRKVMLGGMVPGTLDAFHIPTGTVVDFKFCGPDTIAKYRRNGPPATYVAQVHGYGSGLAEEGHTVRRVALAFFPRAASLTDFWLWEGEHDPAVPARLLTRMELVYDLLDRLGLWDGANPGNWEQVPAIPGRCYWCPFYRPGSTNVATGCPGKETP